MLRRRLLIEEQSESDEWTVITEEYALHGDSTGRFQLSPTIPLDGDWNEMELTVEAVSGEMSYLTTRLNYSSSYYQYIDSGPYTSPIQYNIIKKEDGEKIITRLHGTKNIGGAWAIPNDAGNLGLWLHWGTPTQDMIVRGTIKYR